jgi:hypothetical protein
MWVLSVISFVVYQMPGAKKSQLLSTEPENEVTLTAFRLLTMDLLTLFQIMNEGTINVLGKIPELWEGLWYAKGLQQSIISKCPNMTRKEH